MFVMAPTYLPRGKVGKGYFITINQEAEMDEKGLKKILAGFCIAGLIAGSTFTLNSCATGASA